MNRNQLGTKPVLQKNVAFRFVIAYLIVLMVIFFIKTRIGTQNICKSNNNKRI